jgi:hypothetical protein
MYLLFDQPLVKNLMTERTQGLELGLEVARHYWLV